MAKKKEQQEKPKVAPELDGLEVNIDSFGEIQNSLSIDKINDFLNKNVDDKKLRDRDDLDEIQGEEEE
ncbi:hypothetical protein BFP97_17220 [Roseivirga sp. 4D4]|uniref:hypothetical protein n=1 Tax=Roseivirga sp. 4D4 TaxID=1889784 RepID=UPI000853BBAD|nr:hypothetical protein [Roseivirga sp. 4D4]OEK03155.1 hypothetical protein BFP97_17220 [Roseivirga sp. 4D4]